MADRPCTFANLRGQCQRHVRKDRHIWRDMGREPICVLCGRRRNRRYKQPPAASYKPIGPYKPIGRRGVLPPFGAPSSGRLPRASETRQLPGVVDPP